MEKTLAVSKECREKELKEHTADLEKRLEKFIAA